MRGKLAHGPEMQRWHRGLLHRARRPIPANVQGTIGRLIARRLPFAQARSARPAIVRCVAAMTRQRPGCFAASSRETELSEHRPEGLKSRGRFQLEGRCEPERGALRLARVGGARGRSGCAKQPILNCAELLLGEGSKQCLSSKRLQHSLHRLRRQPVCAPRSNDPAFQPNSPALKRVAG